jgi:hypothetical protein
VLNIIISLLKFYTVLEWYILRLCSMSRMAATSGQDPLKDECKTMRGYKGLDVRRR